MNTNQTHRTAAQRRVRCYHCNHDIEVAAAARTASCPQCFRGIVLDDLAVKDAGYNGRLATCGKVMIHKKARTITKAVEASEGVHVEGSLDAVIHSGGPVVFGSTAKVRGDCTAPTLVIEAGAVIAGGYFRIGPAAERQTGT